MDINIQRELESINSLFNVSKAEKKNLKNKTNEFISTELSNINNNKEQEMYSRINNILEQICNDIHNEFKIEKKKLNNILNQHKFKIISDNSENIIDDDNNKYDTTGDNNKYDTTSDNNKYDTTSDNENDNENDNDNDNDNENDNDNDSKEKIQLTENNTNNSKKDNSIKTDSKKDNSIKTDSKKDNSNNVLTTPIKCPAPKKKGCSEFCGRLTIKTYNFMYCGYHKKYFKP